MSGPRPDSSSASPPRNDTSCCHPEWCAEGAPRRIWVGGSGAPTTPCHPEPLHFPGYPESFYFPGHAEPFHFPGHPEQEAKDLAGKPTSGGRRSQGKGGAV